MLNPKYDGYQRGLKSMVYKSFDKKIGSGVRERNKTRTNVNKVLTQELHKLMISKIQEKKSVFEV